MIRGMKDSGVEWIGEIPEDWNIGKIKNSYDITLGKMLEATNAPNEDVNNYLCAANIKWNGVSTVPQKKMHFSAKEKAQYLLSDGDVLISEGGAAGTSCVYHNELSPCYIQNSVHRCTANRTNNTKYLYYWMHVVFHSGYINSICHKATIMHYTKEKVEQTPILVLSPTEQQQIVHFLDRKCTAIDTAIEKTKKSIEKLEEYKKAVITKAVTKGINPNAKMKDAHFLWLTAIPENWGIYKLNHILDYNHPYPLGDGDHGSIKADSYVSSGIPFIRVQNLGYAEPINIENVVYITEAQNQKIQNSTLAPNDILFAKTGATIGKTAIMPQTISRANTTSHIGKITVDTRYYVPKYIFYALSSEIGNHQLWSIANKKATRPEVGLDEVKYIKLCIPLSVTEQKQIADFLDEKLNQINNAISNHANLIRKLEEYKKSLIYYAVTGKIDCRNEVI